MSHTHTPYTDAVVAALEGKTDSFALSHMTNHARTLEEQRDQARVNAQSNSEALAKAVAELRNMQAECVNRGQELTEMHAAMFEARRERDHLKSLLFDEGKNFSNLTEEYERLGKDLATAQARISELEKEVADFKANNRYHRGHTAGYEEAKEKYSARVEELERQNEALSCDRRDVFRLLNITEGDFGALENRVIRDCENVRKLAAYERPVDSEEVRMALSRAETADDDFPTERSLAVLARAYRQQAAQLACYDGAKVLTRDDCQCGADDNGAPYTILPDTYLHEGDRVLVLRAEQKKGESES